MKLAEYLETTKTSQAAFAKRLGVSQGLVYQWISGKRPVSAEQCPVIERLTEGAVACEELNDKVDWAFVREYCCKSKRCSNGK
ncbi:transcriptional regulator [Cupriavidus necator]|uniref:transcriptional regulator n=1 Tax=Cupriavidus necator TaxID=106590 RepID=UPI00068FC2A6|nr:helix-turn-helix domain-containing protein [Cupriavidus necator]